MSLVRISQRTEVVSILRIGQLMMFRNKTGVYCDDRMKHMNKICVEMHRFSTLKKRYIFLPLGLKRLRTLVG
jgi:hypothetical protein